MIDLVGGYIAGDNFCGDAHATKHSGSQAGVIKADAFFACQGFVGIGDIARGLLKFGCLVVVVGNVIYHPLTDVFYGIALVLGAFGQFARFFNACAAIGVISIHVGHGKGRPLIAQR